ncbi:hypothetical protein [Edaphocola aurantiacus]|uniref:hypothetical protein n=1 Tax=Edaphocola aurantiacus TaxID=2601682 RepID=UPI001C94E80A|nr:hypothetical protein [Edaphocola aurantiacus]
MERQIEVLLESIHYIYEICNENKKSETFVSVDDIFEIASGRYGKEEITKAFESLIHFPQFITSYKIVNGEYCDIEYSA